ncbi:hypothetical protein LTR95_002336 [Oleoguttula sp. CCFEE 5521]
MQAAGVGFAGGLIPRRAHKKSKNGCRTCKVRKVKCDERRPLCRNCERHFVNIVECDFEGHVTVLQQAGESSSAVSTYLPVVAADIQAPSTTAIGLVGRQAEPLGIAPAVASGRLDPFDARPRTNVANVSVDALMSHYLTDFAYRSFPIYASRPLIELWWPFVRDDELTFHVTLLLSSIDLEKLQTGSESIRTRELLDQCLQLLNQRVADPVAGVSDHTIVSIACLAAVEHDKDNMKALSMHTAGLKQAVGIRGGLEAIRSTCSMTANFIFWISMISTHEPSLLQLGYGDLHNPPRWFHEREAQPLLTHSGNFVDLLDFGVDVPTANLLREIQRLTKLYTTALDGESAEQATNILSHLCSVIDSLFQLSREQTMDAVIPGLSQSCRLAGCLHILTPMSGYFPNPTLMLHTLVRDLKSALTQVLSSLAGRSTHLLLWLLAVGGITAHSMPERSWFVGHLVVAITDLDIGNWDPFREYLVALAFHDNFCDISFQALWVEVERKRATLDPVREQHFEGWCSAQVEEGSARVREVGIRIR